LELTTPDNTNQYVCMCLAKNLANLSQASPINQMAESNSQAIV